MLEITGVFLLCLGVSALDSLCDAHFGDAMTSRWRRPRRVNLGILSRTTDLWHFCKWGRFYLPLIALMGYAVGAPWGSGVQLGVWVVTAVASWLVWRAFSPWVSMWL